MIDSVCINPIGLDRKNFRHDQSIFNIVFWSKKHFSDPTKSWNTDSSIRANRDRAASEAQLHVPTPLGEIMPRVMKELKDFAAAQSSNVIVHLSPRYWSFAGLPAVEPQPIHGDVTAEEPEPGRLVIFGRRRYLNRPYLTEINRFCKLSGPLGNGERINTRKQSPFGSE